MTQSSLQTQCPKCKTRFRVTSEQLGVARGKVRCGNCMEIFNAVEHQINSGTPGEDSSRPPLGSSGPEKLSAIEEDFIFADNPEEDATEGHYAGTRLSFSEDELSDSFRSFDQDGDPGFADDDEEIQPEKVDESWAEAILEDDDPQPDPALKQEPEQPAAPARKAKAEPAPAPEPEHKPKPAPEPGQKRHTPPPPPPAPETAAEEADDFFIDPGSEPEPDFGLDPNEGGTRPITATAPFHDLRHDPVSVGHGRGGKLRSLLWGLVILALIGILVSQVVWFQFDRLSAIPQLRPFYEKGCELAGCELAPLIDLNAIQSRKLVVRTDPSNRSQLVVDAVIINRAGFEQPFPAIALTFSNLNGDVVAQSIFTPEEYLAGDGVNLGFMPPDTPVRIAIQIRDPGRDAVNYNLSFRPYSP